MAGSDDEIPSPLPPPPQTSTQQAPHTVSTIKLRILKKGEYDIWAMKMEHYLSHTDYPIWEVIQKGNGPGYLLKSKTHIVHVPKANKRVWNGLMSKRLGLGYGFTKKACFVCGSFSHLIRDCDFYEKRMAKQVELNKKKGKGTSQGENRPLWNNVQRLNHQNQFVPTVVLTRTGRIPVNTVSHNFNSQAVSISATRKVNVVRPIVNENRPRNNFYKSLSPIRMPFNRTTAPRTKFSNQKVNTVEDNPQRALKNKGIVDSGCSRHMTGNKAYLAEYQNYNGDPVAFGGSKGYITGKDRSINHKTYYLVITDDFKRFSWVFFLRTKDETSGILKDFIRPIKIQLNQKVKTIRCDNGTEFKNRDIIEFCGSKGIKREYSNARTPQQNRVTKRKNKTLIEAARTMLADLFLPNTFWAEAVSTACYVLNRVLVTKPQNKTPYELITGKIPIISYIRPFGCHVTILNTIDNLGKFEGKSDEGFLVGYSLNSKAFRVYNLETKRVEENLHITFLENKPNVAGKGPNWLFDLDYLTDSMNYQPVRSENQANKNAGPKEANHSAGTQDNIDAGNSEMEAESAQDYFVLPIWSSYTSTVKSSEAKNEGEKSNKNTGLKTNEEPVDQEDQAFLEELERLKRQEKEAYDAAEALRKEFAQDTEDLLLQAGAARAPVTRLKSLTKDEEAADIDVHLYRSMIGSLMYLTASRPDIMFAVYACSRFQIVTMLEQILTGNPQQELVNFLAGDSYHSSARSRQLWLLLLLESRTSVSLVPEYHTFCFTELEFDDKP
ncbi:ribonuclease H-like domain-containing protein [Tanacetum coccineum]